MGNEIAKSGMKREVLFEAIQAEWEAISADFINNFMSSTPKRCAFQNPYKKTSIKKVASKLLKSPTSCIL